MDTLKTIDIFAKPQRDAAGKFVKGNTLSEGNVCEYCPKEEEILKKVELFSLWTRGKLPDKKLHMPYLEDLVDEDFLNVLYDTFLNWVDEKNEHARLKHGRLIQSYKKLFSRQRGMLLKRTLGQNAAGAIFQLKANHGMMESEKRILAGDSQNPVREKLEIEITQAKKYE